MAKRPPAPSILGPILNVPKVKTIPRAPRGPRGRTPGQIAGPIVRPPAGPKGLTPRQITRGAHIRGPTGMTPRQAVIASRAAARTGRRVGTSATIPPHAKTPAVASTRAVTATAAAHAQAQRPPARARTPAISYVPHTGTPAARTTAGTTKTSAGMTDAQLIQAMLAPQYAQSDQAIARAQEIERQNQAVYAGLTKSYQDTISSIPANVAGTYAAAIGQTSALAGASADRLAAANPNASTQAMLQAIGAPAEQQAAVTAQGQNVFGGGSAVHNYLGGTIPGQTLARTGAAQTAYAQELPAVVAARGIQGLHSLQWQAGQTLQGLMDARGQIALQIPKLTMDIQNQRTTNFYKQRALDIEAQGLGLRKWTAKTSAKLAGRRIDISAKGLKLRGATAQVAANLRFAEVYGYDPVTGRPSLAAIKAARADKAKSKKPPTAATQAKWNQMAGEFHDGKSPKTHYDSSTGTFIADPSTTVDPIQYYPALRRLMAAGATLQQAQKVLNAYYPKGGGGRNPAGVWVSNGRPHVSLQGRIALEKAGMPLAHPMDAPSARQKTWLQQHRLWSD